MEKGQKIRKRIGAWLLVLVMAASLVMVPANSVEAAETEIALSFTAGSTTAAGSADNQVTINLGNGGYSSTDALKSGNITKLRVTFKVTAATAAGDMGVQAFINAKDCWEGSWKNISASGTEQTVELDLTQYYSKSAELWNFGLQFENVSGITYQITKAVLVQSDNSGTSSGGGSGEEVSSDEVSITTTKPTSNDYYTEFAFSVKNNTSSSFTGIQIVIPSSTSSTVQAWKSDVKAVYDSTIPGYVVYYNITLGAGAAFSDTDYKVGISMGSSAFGTPYVKSINCSAPDGSGSGGSIGDTTTDLNLDIEYNYAKLLQESLYFYDANMCGPNVGENTALSWRGDCHTEDQTVTYNGQTVDVSGGFHDAGDHVKFGLPQGYSAAVLALSYYEFGAAYDELGQTEHYKKIMDYFCDYFVNCTIYSDNTNKTGSVRAFCYQVGDGTDGSPSSDHGYWGAPETQSGYNRSNMTLFTTDSMTATDIVSISACALALHAYNFPNDAKSNQYLQTAKDLFAYAKSKAKTTYVVAQYASDSWEDDYCSAAAALYLATGDTAYQTELNNHYGSVNTGWLLCWNKTWGIASALKGDWNSTYSIAGYGSTTTAQGFKFIDGWGSCRYNTAEQFLGLVYDKNKATNSFGTWATGQMKYILGNNNNKRCFVVGYNANSSKYPHHRAASNSTDAAIVKDNHYVLLGALVGGPKDTSDSYTDSQSAYQENEVAIDYNATLVGAAAGLYLLHKDDADAINTLASQEELSSIGVTKYYGSGSGNSVSVTGVTLDKEELSLQLNGTKTGTLKATITPATATNKAVTWSSTNTSIATVSGTGTSVTVTAVGVGTATIKVATEDGSYEAECTVTVTDPVTAFTLNKSSTVIHKGATETLSVASTTPSEPKQLYTVSWASGNTAVASVNASTGVVTANGIGTATITATITNADGSTVSNSCEVTVDVPLTRINLNSSTLKLKKGETTTITASPYPDGAVLGDVKWSSDTPGVVTVSGSGATVSVTAVKSGTATITAVSKADSSIQATCTVTVTTLLDAISFDVVSTELEKGDTKTITCTINPADADISSINWNSSAANIATVTGGSKVTVGSNGKATVTATITAVEKNDNKATITVTVVPKSGETKTATCSVSVVGKKVTGISISEKPTEAMTIGDTRTLQATAFPEDADDPSVSWTSNDETVATVNGSGMITAVGKGTATITATAGDKTDTYTVKVNKKTQAAPNITYEVTNRTSTGFTIKGTVSNAGNTSGILEYSINGGGSWVVPANGEYTFTSLSAFKAYTVIARYQADTTYNVSSNAEQTRTVYTLVANPYTIDVSRLRDANYVDALRTASGTATVSYDTATGVLTLADSSKTYTITGSNNNVTVKTTAGMTQTVILSNATIKDLDVTNTSNATITMTGVSTVTGSISAANALTLNGSGTLNAGTIKAENGTVNIESGTVNAATVTAKDINISGGTVTTTGAITAANDISITGGTVIAKGGISAGDKVVISGGKTNVTATGSDGNPAISGSDITITDASVTATGGNGAPAISSTGNITMENANVTVNTTGDGSTPAIQAGDGDEYKIIIDGGSVTGNSVDNMYSKNPVDSQGNTIVTYKVSIMDEAANRNETKSINAGSSVTLQAAGKKGYRAGWKDQTGKTYVDGTAVTIESDCSFTAVYTKISVTDVKVTVSAVELETGKTVKAAVKVLPADAADTSVTWSSSNPAVAAVDSNGVITAKAKGTVVITVTSNDTKVSDSVTIIVKEASKPAEGSSEETDVKASSILLTASVKGAGSVPVKGTYKLAPKKSMTLKIAFAPENAVKEKVTFKSSNTKIAKVNAKGKITAGKKAGKATITVTSENGLKKTFKVQVMKKAVTKVKIKASKKTIKVKKTFQLKAVISPSKTKASNSVYWKSSNSKIATVSSKGKVKGIKKGKVKITAIATDGSGKKATITIKVKK